MCLNAPGARREGGYWGGCGTPSQDLNESSIQKIRSGQFSNTVLNLIWCNEVKQDGKGSFVKFNLTEEHFVPKNDSAISFSLSPYLVYLNFGF